MNDKWPTELDEDFPAELDIETLTPHALGQQMARIAEFNQRTRTMAKTVISDFNQRVQLERERIDKEIAQDNSERSVLYQSLFILLILVALVLVTLSVIAALMS